MQRGTAGSGQRALYHGEMGGTLQEELLETPIISREPRSFPTTEWLVTRAPTPSTLDLVLADGTTKYIDNWEVYMMGWWYEYRERNATCPFEPSGFAATTDWTLFPLCLFGDVTKLPKTIFVYTHMLPHFMESTIHFMPKHARFILISGGIDRTIPSSTGDLRYKSKPLRDFYGEDSPGFVKLTNDTRILHWFAENRDADHPKMSTWPTGFTLDMLDGTGQKYSSPDYKDRRILNKPIFERNLTVLVADRVRDRKGQWYDRAHVEEMCMAHSWCDDDGVQGLGMDHETFLKRLHTHPFVTCVHGGGVDPSPKAFEAIHEGTIPILKKGLIYDAYSHLPVAWVDDWDHLFHEDNRTALLSKWRDELGPYYVEGSALRRKTLDKLKTAYWREVVEKKYESMMELEAKNLALRAEKEKGGKRSRSLVASKRAIRRSRRRLHLEQRMRKRERE